MEVWYYDPLMGIVLPSEYEEEDVVRWVDTFPTWPTYIYFFWDGKDE